VLNEAGQPLAPGERGEVAVSGPNLTPGYYRNDAANAASFVDVGGMRFLRTGDQGYLDADGYLFLSGRLKELINRGGEKISPVEIDAAMLECPAVAEAVSFAVPDAKYGEEVHAAIVCKPGSSLTEPQLTQFLSSRLAAYKLPKRFYFAHELPKTATGKMQRNVVAKHFTQPQQQKQ